MWHILNLGSKMTFDKKKKKYIIEKVKVEILVLNLNVFFFFWKFLCKVMTWDYRICGVVLLLALFAVTNSKTIDMDFLWIFKLRPNWTVVYP